VINRVLTVLGLSLGVTSTEGCTDDFDPPSLVNKLRVLAVMADTPFAQPGQQVNLQALAYDPEQRALSWGWGSCEAIASTDAVDCLRQSSFAALQVGSETTHTLQIPQTTASYVGVVVVACPGTIQTGSTDDIPIACIDQSGRALPIEQFELGLKRIFVRDSALNQNPQLQAVSWNAADWGAQLVPMAECERGGSGTCTKFAKHEISVDAAGASEDSVDLAGLPIREQSVVQFYATGGEFDDDVRLASDAKTKWHAKKEDAGKRVRFWFVVRDDRGGVSWLERSLQVPF
jgi:hypothetical protein